MYDTTLLHHPDDAKAVGPRGVYHARLGRREAALADARAALALADQAPTGQEKAFTIYQVAGIYALTSRQQPEDHREALRLLALALRTDASWLQVLPDDHDFDAIRDRPEFHELIRAVAVVDQTMAAARRAPGQGKDNDLKRCTSRDAFRFADVDRHAEPEETQSTKARSWRFWRDRACARGLRRPLGRPQPVNIELRP